ncbi:glycohydrolase toxin TNT-related protein [Microbacterium arborescens]
MAQHELPDISAHPLNNMNTEAIETAAAAIEALGAGVGENGTQAVSAWAPISSAYKGPGDAELIAVMVPVGSMATSVKDRTASAARSLRTFKDTADEIKATMATLKSDLAIHTYNVNNYEPPQPATTGTTNTGIYGTTTTTGSYNGSWNAYGAAAVSTDWRDDSALVAENERIIKALNDAVERMHEAERQCASELRGLHGLTALTAGDGGYKNGQYGVDSIPHDAATPWGTANPDDENCAEAAGSWVVGAGQDLVGLVGMRWDEDGNFSWTWDNFAETWTGMASLITYNPESGQWFDWGHAGDTWLGVGQDFIAYDRWGENPEGAATDVVLNVVSSIGVVGLVSKIGKVGKAGRAGRVDADVDVDLDAADFDVPVVRFDTDIDLDFGDLDLDLDLPDGRPDVPNGRPDVPATAISDATGGPDGPSNAPEGGGPHGSSSGPEGNIGSPGGVPGGASDGSPSAGGDTPGDRPGGDGPQTVPDGVESGAPVDPFVANRTPNTDVDFQASPEFDSAVDARQQAVIDRREAVADRNAAIAALNDLGVEVDPGDLTKSKIDTTIDDLIDDVRENRSLTPDEVAERVEALRELRETAWNERESFVGQVNASEVMGDAGARDAIRSQGADVVVDGRGASAGQFDQVGLTRDGTTLIVAEAKGGAADLSSSGRLLPDGSRAPQGSTAYFNEVFRLDPTLQQWLADNPAIARGLLEGDIDIRYQLVRTDGNGVVRIEDLALDSRSLDLRGEGMPARQPEFVAAGGVRADAGAPTVVDAIVQDASGIDTPDNGSATVVGDGHSGGTATVVGDGSGSPHDLFGTDSRGADDGGRSGHDPSGYPRYGSSTPVADAIAAGVDPVHNGLDGVPGEWRRVADDPITPKDLHYGEPMAQHGHATMPEKPAAGRSGFDIVGDTGAPYGRHPDGTPLSAAEYDARYTTAPYNWDNYPPNAGAVRGTRVEYSSIQAFIRDYGLQLDRVGKPNGPYLGLMPDGVPATFEDRSLPISSLGKPLSNYQLSGSLPDGWSIEVSRIAPAFGRQGGAMQVLVKNAAGEHVPVSELEAAGVLL